MPIVYNPESLHIDGISNSCRLNFCTPDGYKMGGKSVLLDCRAGLHGLMYNLTQVAEPGSRKRADK